MNRFALLSALEVEAFNRRLDLAMKGKTFEVGDVPIELAVRVT